MENRFDLEKMKTRPARVYLEDYKKMVVLEKDYGLTFPANGNPYISISRGQDIIHAENIMLSIPLSGSIPAVYSGDIVQYHTEGNRLCCGVVCYSAEKYMWVIENIPDGLICPLFECKVEKILGNVWEDSDLLDKKEEELLAEPLKRKYAALDEPIPGINDEQTLAKKNAALARAEKTLESLSTVSVYCDFKQYQNGTVAWSYLLENNHSKKSDSKLFNITGKAPFYYAIGSLIIALDKITSPRTINLYTERKAILDMINSNSLAKLEENGWKTSSALAPFVSELQILKKNIDRLGGMIYAYNTSKDIQKKKLNFIY